MVNEKGKTYEVICYTSEENVAFRTQITFHITADNKKNALLMGAEQLMGHLQFFGFRTQMITDENNENYTEIAVGSEGGKLKDRFWLGAYPEQKENTGIYAEPGIFC